MASVPTRHTDIFSVLNSYLPEPELLHQLKFIIKEDPGSVFARDRVGHTPLHLASYCRSLNVCKLLLEADPSLRTVRATNNVEKLPFHYAVFNSNLKAAKYLFELYPESINAPDINGNYPLHEVLRYLAIRPDKFEATKETIKFLLEHDQGAMYTADKFGMLPLHHASRHGYLLIAKHMFDAYPEAIHLENSMEYTPLELARHNHHLYGMRDAPWELARVRNLSEVISFFEYQLHSVAHISLREALRDSDVSLGSIKMMIEMNPQSLIEADSWGQLPVHIACSIGDISVVKFLVDAYPHSLQIRDANNNLPLHIACREGKFDAINYILEMSDHGVGMKGGEGMLPIHLLLFCGECDRDSVEYVDSVGRLLRLNPTSLLSNMML